MKTTKTQIIENLRNNRNNQLKLNREIQDSLEDKIEVLEKKLKTEKQIKKDILKAWKEDIEKYEEWLKTLKIQKKRFEDMLYDYRDIIKFNCKDGYLFVQGIEEKYNK